MGLAFKVFLRKAIPPPQPVFEDDMEDITSVFFKPLLKSAAAASAVVASAAAIAVAATAAAAAAAAAAIAAQAAGPMVDENGFAITDGPAVEVSDVAVEPLRPLRPVERVLVSDKVVEAQVDEAVGTVTPIGKLLYDSHTGEAREKPMVIDAGRQALLVIQVEFVLSVFEFNFGVSDVGF